MLKKANRTVMNMGLAALLVPAALTFSTTSASANDGGAAPAPVQEKVTPSVPQQQATTTTNQKVIVNVSALNIRQGASFSSPVVGTATQGQEFAILKEANGLVEIAPNKWISKSSSYVTIASGKPSASQVKGVSTSTPSTSTASTSTSAAQETSTPAPAPTTSTASGSTVNVARSLVGSPYQWAGNTPSGFDCSGFIAYVFNHSGHSISRTSVANYWNMATKISSPQPGDLVFFQNTYTSGPSHMGIYIGNGQMIHAGSHGVAVADLDVSYYQDHFLGYGRF
ncbi:protease [Priestia megaterium]|uniref:C40 family peptidase n=1 Tax=Priestia megaterium TaxID=1404 RepID=UPI000BF7D893|nr:SH3 domain-containing C40 family peptidase [Priestia megaterium]MBV6734119.1 C40 family peptidase [Priestia megaterium]MDC7781423.1 SH3 domain-containing C40 family peptidase [Priestia megaterium]MDD1511814.1 SH3 domain-containing C40 family peptidase [Priestia megaterium]PFE31625.1 protease [Priestia megaterium]